MPSLNTEEIQKFLPHRYPMLLVDKVIDYAVDDFLKAKKNITSSDPIFQGHFPTKSVYPGVLIIESMAQAAALLGCVSSSIEDNNKSLLYYLVGVDKVRFKNIVVPGDQITLNVKFLKLRRRIWRFSTTAVVGEKFISSAEIMTTVVDT